MLESSPHSVPEFDSNCATHTARPPISTKHPPCTTQSKSWVPKHLSYIYTHSPPPHTITPAPFYSNCTTQGIPCWYFFIYHHKPPHEPPHSHPSPHSLHCFILNLILIKPSKCAHLLCYLFIKGTPRPNTLHEPPPISTCNESKSTPHTFYYHSPPQSPHAPLLQ